MGNPGDSCGTCFFANVIPANAGSIAGQLSCCFNAPRLSPSGWLYRWPIVQSDFWCGEGVNKYSGAHFDMAFIEVAPEPAKTYFGTFSMTNAISVVVSNPNIIADTIKVIAWWQTGDGHTAVICTPSANNTFIASSYDGSRVTGTFGYVIYNNV